MLSVATHTTLKYAFTTLLLILLQTPLYPQTSGSLRRSSGDYACCLLRVKLATWCNPFIRIVHVVRVIA
jgi:hypothetical protein